VFYNLQNPNPDQYDTYTLAFSGAKINFLLDKTLEHLQLLPKNKICFVQLVAGINELSFKDRHEGGIELVPNDSQELTFNVLRFKEVIRAKYPNCLVAIATIPIIDFERATQFYITSGRLKNRKYDTEETKAHQLQISETLKSVNHRITIENKLVQYIPGIGGIFASQLYFHQFVEKTTVTKKPSGRIIKRVRIPPKALTDGVHLPEEKILKWWELIHTNFLKMIQKLSKPEVV
jgi:hypothetical protein